MSTIAAIATPAGTAGLGVVRLSGEDAVPIAQKIFRAADRSAPADWPGYTARYGHVFDTEGDIDDCVALVFRAPHSYTGEDVAELSCHGGVYLLRRVLRAALASGAVMAAPGEFTRRAFVNGKMDLSSAEAVADLISAKGKLAAKSALAAREGALFRAVTPIKETLVSLLAQISAYIDFPDDDVPDLPTDSMRGALQSAMRELNTLLATADAGRILREGVNTVIAGSPNVGKSTLMNLLSGCERSIVTDIPGTTRDIVEETVQLGEVTLRLADTAGLRESADTVEALGVQRTQSRLAQSELIIAVFDASRPLSSDDIALLRAVSEKPAVLVLNKTDLSQTVPPQLNIGKPLILFCAKTGEGLDALRDAVETLCGIYELTGNEPMLAHERQVAAAVKARDAVADALNALNAGLAQDAAAVCIQDALSALLSLTGENVSEAVLQEVFSRFCVGK